MVSLLFLCAKPLLVSRTMPRAGKFFFLGSLILTLFCTGCGNSPGIAPPPPVQTYSLSGQVTPVAAGNGAKATLSGAASATTTADNSGNYSFTNLTSGTYAVTPSKAGYGFTPTSQAVTINGADVMGVNFIGAVTPATYMISGSITPASVGSGATVTLSGAASGSTTADSGGNFSFTSLNNGTYTVTPSSSTATFSPPSQSVTINGASVTGVSFTGTSSVTQNACGNTLSSASPICQVIGAGHLNPAWTVISRHGEYDQNETECNIPSAITTPPLTITTAAVSYTCGNFNANGTVNTTPASWPYTTGDMQWGSFNFTYGTVTVRGKFPSSTTSLWPAYWLLGTNCQTLNIYSGDTGSNGCPNLDSSGYMEIDMVECYNSGGWCQFHVANPGFGIGGNCDVAYSVDTNYHTWVLNWTSNNITISMDGTVENGSGCSHSVAGPMFFILQTQTGGAGGTPNNAALPANFVTDFVQVQNSSGALIFADNFAPDIYFAQSAAGTGSGDDCADARATSSMLAMDWVPGNTLHLCGALTSSITALGSGTSSNPITLTFEPGAYFTASVWSSAINLNGFTYIIVPTIPCGGPSCPPS